MHSKLNLCNTWSHQLTKQTRAVWVAKILLCFWRTHKVQHLIILKRKPQTSVIQGWRLGIHTSEGALSDYRVNVEQILLVLQVHPHYQRGLISSFHVCGMSTIMAKNI